nr:integrase, catalytic region, zinc finger, CCHC-type, peptidase aspartic, catalytic [Tanacetum cinerariifolium]
RETLTEGTEGAPDLGPEGPRVYSNLTTKEKEKMQLNSKFVKNMLPEWGRFVIAVKLKRGLRDSNYNQLYAYLKQHEVHANDNKMTLDRFTQHTVDPLALVSNVSNQQHYPQSSTTSPSIYVQPQTSSNPKNQATIQDDRVVVQNVQGRQNRGQGNNAWGAGATGYEGAQNRVRYANPGQARQIKCCNCNAQENGVALDEEQLLFIACGQDNAVDEDVDEQPIQDLALNVDNVFQADDYDTFNSDVDESPTAQTMFMANLSSAYPVYDEAGPSYDSDILSEVHDHDHYQDAVYVHHEVHKMHDDVQPNYVVDSHTDYTSDSNMIPYDQYVKDNAMPVVQSNVSVVPNDAYIMILNDMHEPPAQHVSVTTQNNVVDKSLTDKLATYKEQVELYERRAIFELTEREQNIYDQLRIVIIDRNIKEENLKKELYSVKMQLASTINHNKSMVEEVMSLKKDFKQKENKYLEEFLDMKALKEKVEDKLYKQDQSLQTVHMLCKPKPYYDEQNKDTLEITEITRKKMNEKMKTPLWTYNKINIRPPDYSKENFLVTFTPQTQLTPEQMFWSKDVLKMKTEALAEQAKATKPVRALTMYPPNTPVKLVLRALTTEIKEMKAIFDELEAEVGQNAVNRKFSEMHNAHTVVQVRCLELETEISKLKDKIQKDDHDVMVKRFSNLEVQHLNLQLKYQHLKESLRNNNSSPTQDSPDFDLVFEIKKLKASIQGKDNVIRKLRTQICQLQETHSDADSTLDFRALDFQITQLTKKVSVLQEQNKLFRVENAKVKQHYKELYDSIKITRAKHIDQTTAMLTKNENLGVQINAKMKCVTIDSVTPKVLAPGMYDINVEPILPCLRNNKEVHLDYLKHLKESIKTLREIVEEAKVERPLDISLASACLYTKHSQELLEYMIGTSNMNTQKHVEQQITQKTNVPVLLSIGVDSFTNASGSKPRSNTKKNRIPPAKSVNRKTVEANSRTNKSNLQKSNLVDSREQCPLTRFTQTKVVPAKKPKNVSTSKIMVTENLSHTSQKPLTRYQCRNKLNKADPVGILIPTDTSIQPIVVSANLLDSNNNWGSNSPHSLSLSVFKCRSYISSFVRFGNDQFGAIMGYGDYVIGDSVITKVYYVEGLGHNLFFVGQFCDSDLEVAFRKHSCYVRDTDGVELIKGSRGSNLYTISVKDTMKSSPICLLSKASKTNSWLWHHCLNHLNFDTINDLTRKDLARGLPRLKFEKDHLCSAEDLGKLQPTCDIRIFVGYTPSRKGYRIYNKRTRRIMETIHIQFDELSEPMGPVPPTNKELEILFQPMFDEYLEPPRVERPVSPAPAIPVPVNSAGTPSSTSIDQDAPSPSHSPMHLLQVIHHHHRHYNLHVYIKVLQLNLLSWMKIRLLLLLLKMIPS